MAPHRGAGRPARRAQARGRRGRPHGRLLRQRRPRRAASPAASALAGRILYLPLPYLALLRGDEVAAIIGHELAHYAGGDTAYSQRFLPIYAGVGRSLDAVAAGQPGSLGLLGPSLRLGVFVMERFHLAVRHWSRAREFAADAAGAGLTSAEAAARALLRTGAVLPRIAETLDAAAEAPGSAPADLVAASLDRAIAPRPRRPGRPSGGGAGPPDRHPSADPRARGGARRGPRTRPAGRRRRRRRPRTRSASSAPISPTPPACAGRRRPISSARCATTRRRSAPHLEATAAGVGTEEQVLRDNSRPGAFVLVAARPSCSASRRSGLADLRLPEPLGARGRLRRGRGARARRDPRGSGGYRLWRGERVTLILRPDGLAVPGLDRSIAWEAIADLDIA